MNSFLEYQRKKSGETERERKVFVSVYKCILCLRFDMSTFQK